MSKRTCAIEGCDRPYRCSGFCSLHYDRMRRIGRPDLPQPDHRVCQIPDCDRPHGSQGYCEAHYKRYMQHGDPQAWKPLRKLPTADERDDITGRVLAKCITMANGCIEWRGYVMPSGYGTISWNGREQVVHRVVWTVFVGPIPTDDDWTLDHLCSNRRCVNVGHLEVVTRTVNSERGGGLLIAQRLNAERAKVAEACRHGHPWTQENMGLSPNGGRYCRSCKRALWAKRADKTNAQRRAQRAALAG